MFFLELRLQKYEVFRHKSTYLPIFANVFLMDMKIIILSILTLAFAALYFYEVYSETLEQKKLKGGDFSSIKSVVSMAAFIGVASLLFETITDSLIEKEVVSICIQIVVIVVLMVLIVLPARKLALKKLNKNEDNQ